MERNGRTFVPREDGEVVRVRGPDDLLGGRLELLQAHRDLALLDLVVGEDLELRGEAELVADPDEPPSKPSRG